MATKAHGTWQTFGKVKKSEKRMQEFMDLVIQKLESQSKDIKAINSRLENIENVMKKTEQPLFSPITK